MKLLKPNVIRLLLKDIEEGTVKRTGTFIINDYLVQVTKINKKTIENRKESNRQRVKKHYAKMKQEKRCVVCGTNDVMQTRCNKCKTKGKTK